MEFEIDQGRFLATLTLASNVAERGATMPVLSNVRLHAQDGTLECSTTDMTISLAQSTHCKVYAPGAVCIGVKHLHNIVRTLPTGVVKLTGMDNSWSKITAKRSEFKVMGLPSGDFPELPESDGIDFVQTERAGMLDMIDKTLFSVSTDEARVNLNGALFESDGNQVTMVSTDGHRLSKVNREMDGPALSGGAIIPRKGLDEIRKVITQADGDTIDIGVGGSPRCIFIRTPALTLSVRLSAATFPPWQQVVPAKHERRVEVDRDDITAALRQCAVIAPEKTATVKVVISKDLIRLSSDSPELGAVHMEVPADYDGDQLTAGFNAVYLIESLRAAGANRVALEFQGELEPVVVKPIDDGIDFLSVVMPMRI